MHIATRQDWDEALDLIKTVPELHGILKKVRDHRVSLKSDTARAYAFEVSTAASLGLITNIRDQRTIGTVWLLTSTGARLLELLK
jgi:hypothetical protein